MSYQGEKEFIIMLIIEWHIMFIRKELLHKLKFNTINHKNSEIGLLIIRLGGFEEATIY